MLTLTLIILICVICLIKHFLDVKKASYNGMLLHTERKPLTYEELLQTKEWKAKRESILQRDKHKCVFCGSTQDLQVHHKYYSKYPNGKMVKPWNYPDNALITLCKDCHNKIHRKHKIKVYYRRYSDSY